ncbi:pyridine nucleotide-disulfide oxidoreductase [Lachnoclostridium sp. An169]|uniref:FAD-dependent oxidoreductase n=1 Tax=Lachnoclostridium sp. An169 TaxID=1965569 RepID=UPI000B39F820|nr:FAD-dependent oxidoreductase [Lachnoclostridium sp. An169]OUP80923.1 pyridine nucleotide-disulfide oxidoreductase [Lachnoclostridium sp. An169]
MGKRILIVGGVAGGASAAARIRRLDADASITIFERGEHVSFSNCSLPYYLSRTVEDADYLLMMTPEGFRSSYDIEVRTNSEVLSIDRESAKIRVRDRIAGKEYEESYDTLVLSPGASPIRPKSIEGVSLPHVFTVRNVNDIVNLDRYARQEGRENVAVIGGGFIGLEVAENLKEAGKHVTVVEAADQVMAPFDYDMSQILHKELLDNGVELFLGDGVKAIAEDHVTLVSGREIPADVVVLAIGVMPETALAKDAGLELGETGAIKVSADFCTSDPHIYAVGDAIEVYNSLTHRPAKLPLAGPALRQARTAADAIYGIGGTNKGVIGSCAVRVFGMNAAATGLNEKTAKANGIPCDSVYTMAMDKVGIMPGSAPVHFKLVYEVPTGRILGAQAIGTGNVDKRIDVIATMITMNGTLEDLKELELCYSPVFGTARDIVNLAALVALNVLHGVFKQVHVSDVRGLVESGACIIDVRTPEEFDEGHLKGAVNIPLGELRHRTSEIPKDRPVYLHCRTSQRSYNAIMALKGRGFDNIYNISGSFLGISYYEYFMDTVTGREKILTEYNFM